MLQSLFQIPDLYLFCFLSILSIIISVAAIFLIKHYIPLSLRYTDNAVIGFTIGLVSVMYGVLAGLSAMYLINNNNYTSDAVQREANSIANLDRDIRWLSNPTRNEIHNELKIYLNEVINIEWPLMEKGNSVNSKGDIIINEIADQLYKYSLNTSSQSQNLVLQDMLADIKGLYDARHQRIQMSYSGLDPAIWVVILVGTILTLCINFLFGMNFYLHIITVTAAALMTSSMIVLLIALNKPFQGSNIIEPDPFRSVLTFIDSY